MHEGARAARWLVVDGDRETGEASVAFLRSRGLQSGLAQSGRRVFELFRSGVAVDGILMDIALPRMDGFEVANEILNGPTPRALPIFLVTSKIEEGVREVADRIGAFGLLTKPFDDAILPRLSEALSSSPPPVLVVGRVEDEPTLGSAIAAVPDRPTLAPRSAPSSQVVIVPPPPTVARARVRTKTIAHCSSCTLAFEIPDEVEDDRELVLCSACLAIAAP